MKDTVQSKAVLSQYQCCDSFWIQINENYNIYNNIFCRHRERTLRYL